MQLAPPLHGASRLVQGNVCLVGEKTDVLRSGNVEMRGSIYGHTYDYGHDTGTPPPLPPSLQMPAR